MSLDCSSTTRHKVSRMRGSASPLAIISSTRVSPANRASLHCRAASARLRSSMSVVVPYQFTRCPRSSRTGTAQRGTTDTRHRHVGGALPPHLALQRRRDVTRSPSASRGLRDGSERSTPSRAPPPVRGPYSHASVGCRRRWSHLADGTTPGWAACRGGVAGALRLAGGRRPPSPARLPPVVARDQRRPRRGNPMARGIGTPSMCPCRIASRSQGDCGALMTSPPESWMRSRGRLAQDVLPALRAVAHRGRPATPVCHRRVSGITVPQKR